MKRNSHKMFPPNRNKVNLSKLLSQQVEIPLRLLPVLLPIKLITLMIAGVLHAINNIHLSILPQLLPSIVAPRLRKHNVRTARRSGSVVLRPRVKRSHGRSRDPGSVFGRIITNRKSLQASHTAPLPPFVYRGGWIKLPKTKLYQCLLLQHPFRPRYSVSQSAFYLSVNLSSSNHLILKFFCCSDNKGFRSETCLYGAVLEGYNVTQTFFILFGGLQRYTKLNFPSILLLQWN